ncbi:hypothetical protein FPV67DRAFT_1678294 [Lyophyllum atratum]|nr:hypothetical protein FPV67DRAFT_1678294 [Lyophyllum atratum]
MAASVPISKHELPLDILNNIFELDTAHHERLSPWSQVSPYYRSAAQKVLFSHVVVKILPAISSRDGTRREEPAPRDADPTLTQMLLKNPDLAGYIRDIHISCAKDIDDEPLALPFVDQLVDVTHVHLSSIAWIPPSAIHSIILPICHLIRRCSSIHLSIRNGAWAMPLPWIVGLSSIRTLVLNGANAAYGSNEAFDQITLPTRNRSGAQAEVESKAHRDIASYIQGRSSDFDESFAYILERVDAEYSFENHSIRNPSWPKDDDTVLGAIEHLDVDKRSVESLMLLCYHSTTPRSGTTFQNLRSLTIRGQSPKIVHASNFLCQHAPSSLQDIHWIFTEQSGPSADSAYTPVPPLVAPPNGKTVTFSFEQVWPSPPAFEHVCSSMPAMLNNPSLRVSVVLPANLWEVRHGAEHFLKERTKHIAAQLRTAIPHYRLRRAVKIAWVVGNANSTLDLAFVEAFEKEMSGLWEDVLM